MSKIYAVITERIIELLHQGTVPWRRPWSQTKGTPRNLVTKRPYRGANFFLLSHAGFGSPYWLTFNQAKSAGGNVRRGEKGWPVIFWRITDHEPESEDEAPRRMIVARNYWVFNLEQVDGINPPAGGETARPFSPIESCAAIVAAMPDPPEVRHAGGSAAYVPSLDVVRMPIPQAFDGESSYYATLFHELAHSTGHAKRLDRPSLTAECGFGSDPYCREELVAEMCASMLCAHAGIDDATIENSAAYLSHWIERLQGDSRLIIGASAQAQRAADFILNSSIDGETGHEESVSGSSYYPSTTQKETPFT